jgi:uncharacterized repeat protein (TIGR03987 family)
MDSSATIIVTLALVFYSIGVWSERIAGRLKPWHLVSFVLGLACDARGAGLMFDVHGISGLIAILLCWHMLSGRLWFCSERTRTPSATSTNSAWRCGLSG